MKKTFANYGIIIPYGKSGQIKMKCPRCSHTRKNSQDPCLSVNTVTGVWTCHHPDCGFTGHLEDDRYSIPKIPMKNETSKAIDIFFQSRHISRDTYESQGIFQTDNAIAFPFYKNGMPVNIKYRMAGKKFYFSKEDGKEFEMVLYGVDNISEETIIVEGEIDYLTFIECGFKNVISVPNGANSRLDCFTNEHSRLKEVKNFIIATDNDIAGNKLKSEIIRLFGEERCKSVIWPEGCKDANDVLVKLGKDCVKELIEFSDFIPVPDIITALDISDLIDIVYRDGLPVGISGGWRSLDPYYKILPGKMDVITGVPGSGKSTFIEAMAMNLAKSYGYKTCFFSAEADDPSQHLLRFIARWAGMSSDRENKYYITEDIKNSGKRFLSDHFFLFTDTREEPMTLDRILDYTKTMIERKNIDALVIDPWNRLEDDRPKGVSETEYIGSSLTKIKKFAQKHNIHVWILAHPTKLQKDKDGSYPVPRPYDICGSSHWWNKVDGALSLKRSAKNNFVEVHVQKAKTRNIGRTGRTALNFLPMSEDYTELGSHEMMLFERGARIDEL